MLMSVCPLLLSQPGLVPAMVDLILIFYFLEEENAYAPSANVRLLV